MSDKRWLCAIRYLAGSICGTNPNAAAGLRRAADEVQGEFDRLLAKIENQRRDLDNRHRADEAAAGDEKLARQKREMGRLRDALGERNDEIARLKARVADLENSSMSELDIEAMGYMKLPVGADGKPIRIGDTVYEGDGKDWLIDAVSDDYAWAGLQMGESKKRLRPEWLTHEEPKRYPLDADGAECRPGDTVWVNVPDGMRCEVSDSRSAIEGYVLAESYDGVPRSIPANRLTHTEPDSWEKLERDSGKSAVDYWGCRGIDCCDCPSMVDGEKPKTRFGTSSCSYAMARDILNRAKALAGVTPKCSEATPKEGAE